MTVRTLLTGRKVAAPTSSWHPGGRFVPLRSLDGGRIHVVTVPCEEPPSSGTRDLVLLHGYLQSSWTWRFNLQALAQRWHVHAVCLPGFGWSDKPDHASYRLVSQAERVLELLDVLGLPRTHLVGNSLGGALALQIAVLQPDRVDRLALVNPAGWGLYPMAMLAAVQHEAAAPLLGLPGVATAMRLGLRHGAYANLAVDDAFFSEFLRPLDMPGGRRAALQVARYFNRDLASLDRRLPDVRRPVLVLWGQGDRIVPLTAVQRVHDRLPDARLELYDCSGHCPMEEEPARFNREIAQFLMGSEQPEAT